MMVSYTRARAEGLGIALKGGLMQRPERVLLVGITALACGITANFIGGDYKLYVKGIPFHIFETISIFTIPIFCMAILTNITAIRRMTDAKKAFDEKEKDGQKKDQYCQGYYFFTAGSSVVRRQQVHMRRQAWQQLPLQ